MNKTRQIRVRVMIHGDLRELLDSGPGHKRSALELSFTGKRSLNDLIQSLHIPHTEIGGVWVDNKTVDLNYNVNDGEMVEVRPISAETFTGIFSGGKPPRFLCDVHLWKLARRLRLLGFDTAFNKEWHDPELAEISQKEKRMLLSRDRGLLMRNQVESGLLIRNTDPELQLKEILKRLGIENYILPFTRCMVCNGILKPADMAGEFFERHLWPQIPEGVRRWCREFSYCQSCYKVFWKGSHYKKLVKTLPVRRSYCPDTS